MSLSFLSPAAFSLLLALPLLLVPYLLRQRHQRQVVPALFLYQDISSTARRHLWGRLRLSPLFLLQLLILLLLVAIAARPVLQYDTVGKMAIVLDTSASMQARDPSGQTSLFESAKERVQQELANIPSGYSLSIFMTNPLGAAPEDLFDPLVGSADAEEPLTVGSDLRAVLELVRVSDAPDPSDATLSAFFARLLRDHDFEHVLFVTDRPVTQPPGGQLFERALRTMTLDAAQPNIGISTFRLYRSPFFPDEIHATVGIHATEDAPSQLPLRQIVIEDGQTWQRLAALPLPPSIPPDRGEEKGGSAAQTFSFSRLPLAPSYRARILLGEGVDGLAVDNEAYAVLPPLEEIAVLLVSPTPEIGDSLEQIPNIKLTLMTPQDYDPTAVTSASEFICILFHLTAPEVLPPMPAAFFLPPDDNPLFSLGQSAQQPVLTHWTHGHPLTSYVRFPLLTPAYAQALHPSGWNTPIIESTVGPLLLAGERAGRRYVVTGFDLLPYLGRRNLPASILTLNILGWLSDRASQSTLYKTGTVLSPHGGSLGSFESVESFGSDSTDSRTQQTQRTHLHVRLPGDTRFQPVERSLSLDRQGVYTFREKGREGLVAVNLLSPEETDLGRPLSLNPPVSLLSGGNIPSVPLSGGNIPSVSPLSGGNIRGVPDGPSHLPQTNRAGRTPARPLWPWLLLGVLVLCSLEWWWVARKETAREQD